MSTDAESDDDDDYYDDDDDNDGSIVEPLQLNFLYFLSNKIFTFPIGIRLHGGFFFGTCRSILMADIALGHSICSVASSRPLHIVFERLKL